MEFVNPSLEKHFLNSLAQDSRRVDAAYNAFSAVACLIAAWKSFHPKLPHVAPLSLVVGGLLRLVPEYLVLYRTEEWLRARTLW
jgi:hypothetical protein